MKNPGSTLCGKHFLERKRRGSWWWRHKRDKRDICLICGHCFICGKLRPCKLHSEPLDKIDVKAAMGFLAQSERER